MKDKLNWEVIPPGLGISEHFQEEISDSFISFFSHICLKTLVEKIIFTYSEIKLNRIVVLLFISEQTTLKNYIKQYV